MMTPRERHAAGEYIFILLCVAAALLPGALVVAGFDAPYGISAEIQMWMTAFCGTWPLVIAFILLKREELGRLAVPLLLFYVILTALLCITVSTMAAASWMELSGPFAPLGSPPDAFRVFLASPFAAFLSLLLLAPGLFLLIPGDSGVSPFLSVWLLLLLAACVSGILLFFRGSPAAEQP